MKNFSVKKKNIQFTLQLPCKGVKTGGGNLNFSQEIKKNIGLDISYFTQVHCIFTMRSLHKS